MTSPLDRTRGCLLGGAIGDALGTSIEFLRISEIRSRFGAAGLRNFAPAYGRRGSITDDTQMTLFTAEGLIRAQMRQKERGICDISALVHHAYLRWLLTQGETPGDLDVETDGWLSGTPGLTSRRAPGTTCLTALQAATGFGEPSIARNDSKGCGGVMRVAPVGLFAPALEGIGHVFNLGCQTAALTHGHPSGHLAAGHFAVMIAVLLNDETLPNAIEIASTELQRHQGHEEVLAAVDAAQALAVHKMPDPETIAELGEGWVAEEALAIAIYCALMADNFSNGVLAAINHSGDSDSTGTMTGQILGTMIGVESLPMKWRSELEMTEEIDRMAIDLAHMAADQSELVDTTAYPGW